MLSRERAALLLREQRDACRAFGSPLYADLLEHAVADVEAGGNVVFDLVAPHDARNARADALALRLMAAVHRLVLAGEAPELAAHYPSVGGRESNPWPAFREVLVQRRDSLVPLIAQPCQTNEVGRAAALAFGFFETSAAQLPLRLLEVGASAGLNLRWDQYRYGGGGAAWGSDDSPVDLTGLWLEAPAVLPPAVPIADRRGCDPRPVDATSAEGRLSLQASIWADQLARFHRLRGALDVAARVPATLERESVADWLPRQLADARPGLATVVYHSIVQEYFSDAVREGFHACLKKAGERASAEAPLFWLRLEPVSDPDLRYAVTLTRWPGGAERVVAWAGPHGSDVRRADA